MIYKNIVCIVTYISELKDAKTLEDSVGEKVPDDFDMDEHASGDRSVATERPLRRAKHRRIYERSTEEKIAAAERFRQEGNEAYRSLADFGARPILFSSLMAHGMINGKTCASSTGHSSQGKRNYGLAAVHYRKALLHFDYTFAETEDR